MAITRLSANQLRWNVRPDLLDAPAGEAPVATLGSEDAIESLGNALRGNDGDQPHLFLRGRPGTGRRRLVERALANRTPPPAAGNDLVFVYNFDHPHQPRLLRLPAGMGRKVRAELRSVIRFIRDQLDPALEARPIRNRLQALHDRADAEMRKITDPMDERLRPDGLVLVREEVGRLVRLSVHVKQTGRVISQDDLANLVSKGQVDREEYRKIREIIRDEQDELARLTTRVNEIWRRSQDLANRLVQSEARRLLAGLMRSVDDQIGHPEVARHLEAILEDVLEHGVGGGRAADLDLEGRYGANLLIAVDPDGTAPVVIEKHPSARNLFGSIDTVWHAGRADAVSFQGLRAGSLLQANGGLLIVDADALLEHPECLNRLQRTLTTGELSIESIDRRAPGASLKPDAVPVSLQLVLIGSFDAWRQLNREHGELARSLDQVIDLPDRVSRDEHNVRALSALLVNECERLELPPFDAGARARLVEEAARLDGRGGLSTSLDRLLARARAAARLARQAGDSKVEAAHVEFAIEQATVPLLRLQGDEAQGSAAFPGARSMPGQVHLLARRDDGTRGAARVLRLQCASLPARHASIRVPVGLQDRAGTEDQLEILLGSLLGLDNEPGLHAALELIAADGSVVTDAPGETFSLAALVALLSQVTRTPLRQDIALIGDIDLTGRVLPVTELNERIESLFESCYRSGRRSGGGTGPSGAGVAIPAVQRDELMLGPRIVQASGNDLFQVFAVGSVAQAIELLAGQHPGKRIDGRFPDGSLFARARQRLTR
ncbi:AAA family ATPase [Halomonas denitrificans]|nr:AAA family ATPase [Halomonas denitrificans]